MTQEPPAGRPGLAVGVTGHRALADVERLRAASHKMLIALRRHFGRDLEISTALAEGADRLVAAEAIRITGSRLVAVLPMAVEDYRRDFTSDASRAEFDRLLDQASDIVFAPPAATRDGAYWHAGRLIVERTRVMTALWDGGPPHGPGGTRDVVAYAREMQRPLIWVHAGNRRLGTHRPTSLGAEQGLITVEGLPELAATLRR